jgi:hypothetical protein
MLSAGWLHVKLVLYQPFLLYMVRDAKDKEVPPNIVAAAEKCTETAKNMVEMLYKTISRHYFFRNW